NDRGEPRESQASRSSAPPKILPIETPAISLDELKRLTSNFGTKALVGEGSYGRVFSVTLSTGESAGVKKLDPGRKGVRGLDCPVLIWNQRVKIAYGAAKGLECLHEKVQPSIVHRNVRSSNVLVFDELLSKIADFNLTNQSPDTAAHLHSTRILGTFGYHAPEYAMTGQLTQKSDVYSFGIVLLELLIGRKPVDHTMPKGQQSLVTWATPRLSEDKVKQCIDPKLNNDFPPKAMAKVSFPLPLILEFQTMN
ncbi:hypothetical protein IFM89_013023, partial [Coptis chinensis]